MILRSRRGRDEEGSVLVLVTLLLLPMLLLSALVVDVASVRLLRRQHRAAADTATRAGVSELPWGPWAAVCRSLEYLLTNDRSFSSLDPGSVAWSSAATPPSTYATDPCASRTAAPYTTPCAPGARSTWAKLTGTAAGGRITVEIQSGYALPDPRFSEDALRTDGGDPVRGSCDNLAVIVTDQIEQGFASVAGFRTMPIRIRSVSRLTSTVTLDYVAALQLLEQNKCGVLQTGGANTRVVVQAYDEHPGVIQIDSAADAGSCPQPIINGQATAGGPSIIACSTNSTLPNCLPGTGGRPSRVGVYALGLGKPAANIATPYPGTYGDSAAMATPRSGRKRADVRYRQSVASLDAQSQMLLSSSLPPGCTGVLLGTCTGLGVPWVVLGQTDCNSLGLFFAIPGRTSARHIWFNCDLNVSTPLTLTAADATVIVTGQLTVSSTFGVNDPRTFYIGGRETGNKIGLDVGGTSSRLNVNNLTNGAPCATRTGANRATTLVVGRGSMNVASGAEARLCQTSVYLASGWGRVPATDGTTPCTTPCSGYSGTISVSSGAGVDWSAPNGINGRQPTDAELATTNPFEDIALWTEAGGNTNGLTGGATTSLTGIYFLPNADSFNLAGNGSLPVMLSAQFISRTLKVTGGATVYLVPNPEDSIQVIVYTTALVR
jgi:hypothetical protein